MRRNWTVTLFLALSLLVAFSAAPALAQGGDPPQRIAAPQDLTFFTLYPAQEVAIGENITFDFTLRTDTTPQVVQLDTQDLPDGWAATFKGGGRIIEAAYVEPENETKINLRIDPPADVAAGTYDFSVIARNESGQPVKMPIELVVKDKLPPNLSLSIELPTLRGNPDTTFRYNATLKNEGDEDLNVNLVADAPSEFQVNFKLNSQDVTDIPLAANESKHLSIEAQAFSDISAGTYPINVTAQGGEAQAKLALTAEVTGQTQLTVTAPDGRLSGQAYVGDVTPLKLIIQNTGSAPARDVELTASQPNGWEVNFEPKTISEVGAGKQVDVTANVKPADQSVAGDYVVTVHAKPADGTSKSADFRITVLTSTVWGIVGVGLIAVAVVVVGLAVMRFGRR